MSRANWAILLLAAFNMIFEQAAGLAATIKNESKIEQSAGNPHGPTEFRRASVCRGTVPDTVDLKSIELTSEDLKKGVPCVSGDFDGNGYLDFMFYGNVRKADQRRYSLIIFFKKDAATKTQLITGLLDLFERDDNKRRNYPKYKNVPGLIYPAQGDRGAVFFFDKKSGLFKEVPYVYPKNYETGE